MCSSFVPGRSAAAVPFPYRLPLQHARPVLLRCPRTPLSHSPFIGTFAVYSNAAPRPLLSCVLLPHPSPPSRLFPRTHVGPFEPSGVHCHGWFTLGRSAGTSIPHVSTRPFGNLILAISVFPRPFHLSFLILPHSCVSPPAPRRHPRPRRSPHTTRLAPRTAPLPHVWLALPTVFSPLSLSPSVPTSTCRDPVVFSRTCVLVTELVFYPAMSSRVFVSSTFPIPHCPLTGGPGIARLLCRHSPRVLCPPFTRPPRPLF
ncbi:unnamed protein product [Arctia plantaginis]|uniref:Uncharacterized protein n=1 Tax=Arctia plantaginis TaxID=874455 RepID=A0A8S1BV25_ARCPL|nr:unnamed protein product [Arctia plantaginis]